LLNIIDRSIISAGQKKKERKTPVTAVQVCQIKRLFSIVIGDKSGVRVRRRRIMRHWRRRMHSSLRLPIQHLVQLLLGILRVESCLPSSNIGLKAVEMFANKMSAAVRSDASHDKENEMADARSGKETPVS
jgi:hypothetical protein